MQLPTYCGNCKREMNAFALCDSRGTSGIRWQLPRGSNVLADKRSSCSMPTFKIRRKLFSSLSRNGSMDTTSSMEFASERDGETRFKRVTASFFYRLMGRLSDVPIPVDTGDFRLMDRRVVGAMLSMPERDRFVRGMVSWLGFSQIGVPYHREARKDGVTKFSLFKMIRFAMDAIFSFSILPLRIATWMGFFASGLSVLGILTVLVDKYLAVPGMVKGWTSTVIAVLFIGGVQLICIGIIGEYVGRIYGESKRRPLYVVRERLGFETQVKPVPRTLRPKVVASK